jgi:hypothetical protein
MNSGIAGFNASDGSAVMGLCAEVGSSEAAAAPPGRALRGLSKRQNATQQGEPSVTAGRR